VTKITPYSDLLEASIKGFDEWYPEKNNVKPYNQRIKAARIREL
jgi:hypothetical protein